MFKKGDRINYGFYVNLEVVGEDVRYHRRERGSGRFKRSIQLPFPVEVDGIEATFKNGVLNVSLPRAEEDKPRKISVKSV